MRTDQGTSRGRSTLATNAAALVVFTIGYSGRTLPEFIGVLQGAGVTRVVDIRELPLSRRRGFSKTPLREALAKNGIEYVHVRAAGNPYRAQKHDIERCLALYSRHLDSHPEAVAEVAGVLVGNTGVLLCFEAEAAECHRSILGERLRTMNPRIALRHL